MANINLSGSIGSSGAYILGSATVEITSNSDHTLTVAEYTNQFLKITSDGSITGQRNIIAPLISGNTYIVKNNTTEGFAIEFKGATGTGVVVPANGVSIITTDGTNYFATQAASNSSSSPGAIQPQSLFSRGNAGLHNNSGLAIGSILVANASGLISSVIYDPTTTSNSGPSYWFLRENSNDVVKFDTSKNRLNVIPFDDQKPLGSLFDFTVDSNGDAWILAGNDGYVYHINSFPEYVVEVITLPAKGRYAEIQFDSANNALVIGAWAFGDEPTFIVRYSISSKTFSSETSIGSDAIHSMYISGGFLWVATSAISPPAVKVVKCNLTTLAVISNASFPDTGIIPSGWSSYSGNLFVAAVDLGAIYRINETTLVITKFSLPGGETSAVGTAVDPITPALWVSGASTNTSYQITGLTSTLTSGMSIQLSTDIRSIAGGITYASLPNSSIIITDEGIDKWYQFDTNGTNFVAHNQASLATELPAGPDGYVLTSNGPDKIPSWQSISAGDVELGPIDLEFHEIAKGNLPGFQGLIVLDEEFTNNTLTRFTITSEGTPNTPTISGGHITFVNNSGQNTLMSEGSGLTVPQFANKMRIVSASSSAGNAYENVGVGIIQDSNNFIIANWRKIDGDASIQVKIGGTSNFRGTVSVSWTPPFDIGLSLVANSLVFWQKPNGGSWTPITSWPLTEIDMRTATLSGWKAGFSLATDNSETFTGVFSTFQSGLFGGVSIRDTSIFTNPNGTPLLTGNAVRLTATMADTTGAAYCALLTYDVISTALTHTGAIFVNRSSTIYNDNAAHCIAVGDGTYQLFITTWGTPTPAADVQIQYKHETSLDLRTGINVVSSMTTLSMPNIPSGGGCYDPFVVLDGSIYYMAYTIGPSSPNTNYPALASSTNLTSWTGIGVDTTAVLYEGTRIIPLDNTFWVCAGSSLDTRVYDLTMAFDGYSKTLIDATTRSAYPPHPMFVPIGNYTYHITFDNSEVNSVSGTQGQFRVFRALRYSGMFGPPGPAGPAGSIIGKSIVGSSSTGNDSIDWVPCSQGTSTIIYSLPGSPLASGEMSSMTAFIEMDATSTTAFGHFERRITVKNINGTIQTPNGGTADTDVSAPSSPNNTSSALATASASIVINSGTLAISATTPSGVTANTKANVSWTRGPGYVASAPPPTPSIPSAGVLGYWIADHAPNNGTIVNGNWLDEISSIALVPGGSPTYATSATNGHAGIILNGSSQWFDCASFTKAQPYEVWLVMKQIGWTMYNYIFGGNDGSPSVIDQVNTSPGIGLYAGLGPFPENNLTIGTWGVVQAQFNGASSNVLVNNTSLVGPSNPGPHGLTSFTLGAFIDHTGPTNMEVAALVIVDPSAGGYSASALYTYLSGTFI